MADKRMSNKGKKNNRNNRSKKSNRFIPTQEQRVDKELLQDISVLLSIKNVDDKTICQIYGITDRQLQYIKKHQQKWNILDKITGKEVK